MAMPWRFYGRQREIAQLHDFLDDEPGFDVLAVRGRRQVGKSELVHRYFEAERPKEAAATRPAILFHLVSADGDGDHLHPMLKVQVERDRPDLLDGFRSTGSALADFPALVRHLLDKGCPVVLDEFQRIGTRGMLPGLFQETVDAARRNRDPAAPPRRLIVMGSEQQKLMDMFRHPGAPLYGRIRRQMHVAPWTFGELCEVVRDRGWDRHPNRLLTLWTAYGGMPGHWERFSRETALSDFERASDDGAWTADFLAFEEDYRRMPSGDFAGWMEVALRPLDRDIVTWLAETRGGRSLDTLPGRLETALAARFREEFPAQAEMPSGHMAERLLEDEILPRLSGRHLGLLARRDALDDRGAARWHVSDNHARFQIDVLEGAERAAAAARITASDEVSRIRSERMAWAEGAGAETLAFAALEWLFERGCDLVPAGRIATTDLLHGEWRKAPPAEIDILARERRPAPGPDALWVASVKRNADRHDPRAACRSLAALLAPAPADSAVEDRLEPLRACAVNHLFVSPEIDRDAAERIAARVAETVASMPDAPRATWFVMDIDDMLSGRGPRPLSRPRP